MENVLVKYEVPWPQNFMFYVDVSNKSRVTYDSLSLSQLVSPRYTIREEKNIDACNHMLVYRSDLAENSHASNQGKSCSPPM